jgi:hypothetical protein
MTKSWRKRWTGGGVVNIKMDHKEIGLGGMDWIDLSQDREKRKGLVDR